MRWGKGNLATFVAVVLGVFSCFDRDPYLGLSITCALLAIATEIQIMAINAAERDKTHRAEAGERR
jgi:hypothetical protein